MWHVQTTHNRLDALQIKKEKIEAEILVRNKPKSSHGTVAMKNETTAAGGAGDGKARCA